MDAQLFRQLGLEDSDQEKGGGSSTPGKSTLTSRLMPAPQMIFRVADAETARVLGEAMSGGNATTRIQREIERDGNGVAAGAEAAVERAASSSGSPLPTSIQRQFEGSLGADLSSVRVHTGAESQQAAGAVGAKAYTVGQDIHFAAGNYQPADPFGMHLLAHEVAHTVQQSGGATTRQHKLEVSAPQDAAEHEADRAADAMVRGAPAGISISGGMVARTLDTDAAAADGQKAGAGAAAKDLVMQVSNANDVSDATKILGMLQDNQTKLEKGAAMISPHQAQMGEVVEDVVKGKENKMKTQIPLQAIGQNAAIINDIQLYLTEAGGQTMATDQFQDQYQALQGNFNRLEGVAKGFGVTSFKDLNKDDAGTQVQAAVESGGHTTEELSKTFEQLMQKDPAVRGARERVELSTQALEGMPAKVSDNMSTAISAMQAFRTNVLSATVTEKGVNSLNLRNALQEAKAKAAEATKLSDAAKELVMTGGKEAIKTVAKGVVGAGAMSLSKWGALAAEGGASGGTAVAMAAADKLIIGPAKEMFGRAVANADAAAGVVDAKVQLEANLDAEQKKQDTATIEAFKVARAGLAKTAETAVKAVDTFVKSAVEIELKKSEVTKNFTALSDAIKTASKAQGKGEQGKALAEMTGFLHETEQFVVQANLVIDTAGKGLGVGAKDQQTTQMAKARAALQNIKSRQAWMVYTYPFKKPDGQVVDYYGAQEVNLKVTGPGLDASAADLAGKGRADGVSWDRDKNTQSANKVIPDIVPSVTGMRDKVLAVRNQLMTQVFNGGGKA